MSNEDSVDAVVSGERYVVATVDGEEPNLASLVSEPVVTLELDAKDEGIQVLHGCGRQEGDVVVFLEKDHAGVGRDVRTWEIRAHDGRVEAVARSNF